MQDYPLQAKGVRKGVHGVGLGLAGNVNIRLHGFVIGMTGEFHDDLGALFTETLDSYLG